MFEKVIEFLPDNHDPLFLPGLSADAIEDPVSVDVFPALAHHHGIALDAQGFPELSSLEGWHREHNPYLFGD